MNYIFKNYPSHPWFKDWTFEPRDCSSVFRESSGHLFFQAMDTVGSISQNVLEPEWAIQIPIPENSTIHLLFNGFSSYLSRKKERFMADVLIPEPGVLWGRTDGIPAPFLVSNHAIKDIEGHQWLESESTSVLLVVKDGRFCLTTKSRIKKDAEALADTYLSLDFEAGLICEYEKRSEAKSLFEHMSNHDSLGAICVESMIKSLRPPEGSIPFSWCQSSGSSTPQLDVNEIYPLALAWRMIDIDMAEELITCVLKLQTNSGAIPVLYAPHTTHSVLDAPKPFLAKTVEAVWEIRKDQDILDLLLPLLRRHIQYLLHHYDPKRKGIHCWINRTEPLVPDLFESDMATVDLTVLLLTEVDALNRLRKQSEKFNSGSDYFENDRETLENNLIQQFWNKQKSAFSNAYIRDRVLQLNGLPSFTPLLWDKLPTMFRSAILEKVHDSGTIPGGLSVLSWKKSALNDESYPILQQMLVMHALKTADPNGQLLRDFSRLSLQGFVEWHNLSLKQRNMLPINPVMAAYIVDIQSMHKYRYHGHRGATGKLLKLMNKIHADRFDIIIIMATLFFIYSVHLIYNVLKAPPPLPMLEAQMNSAYVNRDAKQTVRNCRDIIKYYPDDSSIAKLLGGNISMLSGDFVTAEYFYTDVRKVSPDSPGPMIALGLALQLQGKFQEAEVNYYEFCYLFDEIFPELITQINYFRFLMTEGFKTPPKWSEIYRYQLMHEL